MPSQQLTIATRVYTRISISLHLSSARVLAAAYVAEPSPSRGCVLAYTIELERQPY